MCCTSMSYFFNRMRIMSFRGSFAKLLVVSRRCAKLKIQARKLWVNFKLKSKINHKFHGCDFYTDWIYRSYLSNKKRILLFLYSYSAYEFSPACAQSWRNTKIEARRFWANFKLKSLLNHKFHVFDFYIDSI